MKPSFDRWVIQGNCIVGYLYDYPNIPNGTRSMSEAIRFVDVINMEVDCLDGKFRLKDPGTHQEHTVHIVGTPQASLPEVDKSIFLNPQG